MPSSRLRALAPSLAVILFASCSLVWSGVQPAARTGSGAPGDFLARSGKVTEGGLTFPPREDDRTARWSRPLSAHGTAVATHTPRSPEVFRVFTTPKGGPVDLAKVHAGKVTVQ